MWRSRGASIGTISIATNGTFTFTTTGSTGKSIAAGEVLTITAPTSADATAADIALTLAAAVRGAPWPGRRQARAYFSKLTFDAEDYDEGSWHAASNSDALLTGPADVSVVKMSAGIQWGRGAPATGTSALFGIYRWGFSTSQDFNGDIALIACFASSETPGMAALARRSVRLPAPMERAALAHGQCATPPSTGTGVVTFLMG